MSFSRALGVGELGPDRLDRCALRAACVRWVRGLGAIRALHALREDRDSLVGDDLERGSGSGVVAVELA